MVSLDGYSVIVNTAASTNVDEKVLQQEVQRCILEGKIASLPLPKKVIVDTEEWRSSSTLRQQGMLTVSLKPNRRVIAERFASQLSA